MKLAIFISRLPLSFLYIVAWAAAAVNYYILCSKRKVILENMLKAFPKYSTSRIRSLCRRYYFVQAEFLAETMKLLSCKKQWLQRRVVLMNPQAVDMHADKPVLFLSAHQSNWEWAAQVLFFRFGNPFYGVYKPLRSPKLERFVFAIRNRFDGMPLPHKQFARTLIKYRKRRCYFYVVSDREPDRRQKSISLPWLGGQRTTFYFGTVQLACALQCVVFFVKIQKTKRGYYKIYLEPIENQGKGHEKDLMAAYARKLAQGIEKTPENWYWGQPRWRWLNT